jgi:two-component system, chemotaxis family, chemotaxis protein CheY
MPKNDSKLKILLADVSMTSRLAIERILSDYGTCVAAEDGMDCVKAYTLALELGSPYDLICIDLMLPRVGGIDAIKMMRKIEREMGVLKADAVKIIVITAVVNPAYIFEACYRGGANSYLYKPVDRKKILEEMIKLGLIKSADRTL